MFALDTNAVIHFFRKKGKVAERLLATPPAEIAIPAISAYEVETGIAKSGNPIKRRRQWRILLDRIVILPFDHSAATHSAKVRAKLEATGQPIGPLDTLIAGTVLAHNATLVSHNLREFSRVPGLAVIDWYD